MLTFRKDQCPKDWAKDRNTSPRHPAKILVEGEAEDVAEKAGKEETRLKPPLPPTKAARKNATTEIISRKIIKFF